MPMHAGPERSVAATKSYICSLAAILRFAAQWRGDAQLLAATDALPQALERAWDLDWSAAIALSHRRATCSSSVVAWAWESRRKPRSSSRRPAGCTPRRSAQPRCGTDRWRWSDPDLPVLCFAQDDETLAGLAELVEEFRGRGARVLIAAPGPGRADADALPVARTDHAACTPIAAIQSFYRLVNALAIARGRDPDVPPHLRKVTETV